MSQVHLTTRTLNSLQSEDTPYFIRDATLRGFGVKVNPSGQVKYVAELWHEGKSFRKTFGAYPLLSLHEARMKALEIIADIKAGVHEIHQKDLPLGSLFEQYLSGGRLKPRTIQDYREAVGFYLADWLDSPVHSISKDMVEKRFYEIRDKGINGGKPTFSQAAKTMRILSALMNYARADELIDNNPVDVLKLKRVDRGTRKREHYLKAEEVRELLRVTTSDSHPMVLGLQLILYTGLRKNEALKLKWDDLIEVDGVFCLLIKDPKNRRPHYVPVTSATQAIIDKARNSTPYLFPSTQKKDSHIKDTRSTLNRLAGLLGFSFQCHDLRRTFATRATEVGIDYLMVKRLLNHKSNDITAQYIQWHSRENLLVAKRVLEMVRY
ncbi:tyrosine-type recombinase/integrase [Desulfogranum mediterraneum]|uniref:tyrosine-type recombinase/integrase n=1 Tax=Desulfogranum mediterraneum TaxID=160661 RepID=UPI0003FD3B3C|nr:integrase family protein [Desulfogranum mediterraneum]